MLAAYRVSDSPPNVINPLLPHFALVVGFARYYDKDAGRGDDRGDDAAVHRGNVGRLDRRLLRLVFARASVRAGVTASTRLSGQTMTDNPLPADTGTLLEFLFRLGQAYLACGEQTALVELYLRRIASAYGMRRSRVVAFPTAIFITVHDGAGERVTLAEGPTQTLRLDQIADVYTLGEAAQRGEVTPRQGLERLTEILRKPPRFGPFGVVVGHTILIGRAGDRAHADAPNLAAAAILGAIVGALKVFNRDRPILAAPLSVVAAALVSTLVFLAVKHGLPVDPQYALVPPLVTFLPGAMLTFGMVELAYGDMVSGSSRLDHRLRATRAAGIRPRGRRRARRLPSRQPGSMPPRGSSADLALRRRGRAWSCSGSASSSTFPRRGSRSGGCSWCCSSRSRRSSWRPGLFGNEISGFFGMLVATPLGYLIQKRLQGAAGDGDVPAELLAPRARRAGAVERQAAC